jgi:biopolymer transport protein ExbB
MEAWIKFYQDGGNFMHPIAFSFILGAIVMAERMYRILYVYNFNGPELMQKVQRLTLDNNIDEAVKICNAKKGSALHHIFKTALVNAQGSFEEIQDHVEVAKLAVMPKLQERMAYLFTISNVATLLGLLGTVVGLIATFQAVGSVEGSQKQLLLSAGISTALNTTAFGLIVAVPCMCVYGYLYNRINTLMDNIEHYTAQLLVLIHTGSEYFEQFDGQKVVTTQQKPKKAG